MAKATTKTPLSDNSLAPAKRTRVGTQDFFGIKPVLPAQVTAEPERAAPVDDSAPVAPPTAVETPVAPKVTTPDAAPAIKEAPTPVTPKVARAPKTTAPTTPEADDRTDEKTEAGLEPEASPVGEGALPGYDWFLERKESDERTHAYISKDLYDNLAYVMQVLGEKKGFTLTSYLNNVITQHFNQYGPEIRKRIREKEALLKKKRRF